MSDRTSEIRASARAEQAKKWLFAQERDDTRIEAGVEKVRSRTYLSKQGAFFDQCNPRASFAISKGPKLVHAPTPKYVSFGDDVACAYATFRVSSNISRWVSLHFFSSPHPHPSLLHSSIALSFFIIYSISQRCLEDLLASFTNCQSTKLLSVFDHL